MKIGNNKIRFRKGSFDYFFLDGVIINEEPCLGFAGLSVIVAISSIVMICGLCFLGEKSLFECILGCFK